ncbi:hypothetical protein BKA93DRAFT_308373 [Sparassis latifolia]
MRLSNVACVLESQRQYQVFTSMSSFRRQYKTRSVTRQETFAARTGPIRILPEDVLRVIFVLGHQSVAGMALRSGLGFTLCVASVCRFWRKLATQMSQLWSVIDVCSSHLPPVDCLEIFLRRSGTQMLQIYISQSYTSACPTDGELEHTMLAPVIRLLVRYIKRWRFFLVDCEALKSLQVVIPLLRQHAPALEEMTVAASNISCRLPHTQMAFFPFTFSAVNLRSLSLYNAPCVSEVHNIASAFPSLEELVLHGWAMPMDIDCRSFMQQVQPLQHLRSIEIWDPDDDLVESVPLPADSAFLHFLSLEELHLGGMVIDLGSNLLSVFEAHSIQESVPLLHG